MSYEEQLKDERWLEKRDRIINRDFHMCQDCMSGKNLQVHHKNYIEGRMAWDYSDIYLITLCRKCHEERHSSREIPVLRDDQDIVRKWEQIAHGMWAIGALDKILQKRWDDKHKAEQNHGGI